MKVLVLCEDCAHLASLTVDGLKGLPQSAYEFTCITDPAQWSPTRMAEFPVVVVSKANQTSTNDDTPWASDETGQAFLDYANQGRSVLFLHSGTALYKDLATFRGLMGGCFLKHPPHCEVIVEPKEGHDLTTGSRSFTLRDGHYIMEMYDADIDIFLHARSEHGTQPAGWSRFEGSGRVAVLTPSHNPDGWMHSSYQALLGNCLDWCAANQR